MPTITLGPGESRVFQMRTTGAVAEQFAGQALEVVFRSSDGREARGTLVVVALAPPPPPVPAVPTATQIQRDMDLSKLWFQPSLTSSFIDGVEHVFEQGQLGQHTGRFIPDPWPFNAANGLTVPEYEVTFSDGSVRRQGHALRGISPYAEVVFRSDRRYVTGPVGNAPTTIVRGPTPPPPVAPVVDGLVPRPGTTPPPDPLGPILTADDLRRYVVFGYSYLAVAEWQALQERHQWSRAHAVGTVVSINPLDGSKTYSWSYPPVTPAYATRITESSRLFNNGGYWVESFPHTGGTLPGGTWSCGGGICIRPVIVDGQQHLDALQAAADNDRGADG